MMSDDLEVIHTYFVKLGLEPEVADIYLALHTYGPQSISELSRRSNVERTRIYRLLDSLAQANLVEIETHYKRSIIKAAPLSNLQILLTKKEEELRDLYASLPKVQQAISSQQQSVHPTQVQFYKGIEGIKQMFWNETRSTTGNLSILYENMQSKTNAVFFERWVHEFNQRNIHSRSIIGDHFLKTQKEWYGRRNNERIASWESRYIPKEIFDITHSTVIYNDVVAYYNWKERNIFGIEIHNREIADAQRDFFDLVWKQAKPISKTISQQLAESAGA